MKTGFLTMFLLSWATSLRSLSRQPSCCRLSEPLVWWVLADADADGR